MIDSIQQSPYFTSQRLLNTTGTPKKENVNSNSATISAFDKVDRFLNLGSSDRIPIGKITPEEVEKFGKMLSKLLKKGIVGYEVLDVNGRPEKHFIDVMIGDHRLYGKKQYIDRSKH
jgi:hypothetical protein